ncbi:thiamine pyrophosphate-dependent dehydrogenase E1 component subunit alpha [Dactylosporangium sp. CA-233914]|uniref:thiamine pyrophosphate-dependent dehydrogenase E1 component subunit alpha n=1 Tax=Dactylosporangium sp. CA-233914 TaxID=3239934 RepID=UPI003D8E13B9
MSMVLETNPAARRAALAGGPAACYERMFEIRVFEARVNDLFAQGAVHGTTHLCLGQEALAVGLAAELATDDVVTATYRGHGIALALGMSPATVLAEIMGRAGGCTGGLGGSMHLSDPDIGLLPTFAIIGAGLPVAAGAAMAFQTRGERRVAVAVFGDGATNIGAFHEALNLASVWRLPVVFVCDNNVYGEYSRIDLTTSVTDLHVRAQSYAIPGIAVDGMDLAAVRSVIGEAVARARDGGGPTLVEAKTYRFAGHSRADQATYRPPGELEHWRTRDPLALLRAELASTSDLDTREATIREDLETVIRNVSASPDPALADMFSNIWAAGARA